MFRFDTRAPCPRNRAPPRLTVSP